VSGGGLAEVSTSTLERLLDGLERGRLNAPLSRSALVAFGIREQLDALVAALGGHASAACRSILACVLAERERFERPAPELVWTGPESERATARDTAVVLRALFEGARERVVLAGYSFANAESVLRPLHEAMQAHGVEASFFVDVTQPERREPDPEAYGRRSLAAFMEESWPFGNPHPKLYCDRRALVPGPPWASLHAKCVAVDGRRAFVSSANFTTRGQDRNIETGVLLEDPLFASQLERQWLSLVSAGLVLRG
jgi:phosphatidylserine/phosphatidylglycerophosphate/cardiolipin synthase-like enzyme